MAFRLFTLLAVIALGVSTWYLSSPSHRPAQTGPAASSLPGYYLKNAILEIDRSSSGLREDANIERRTAGVTGMCPAACKSNAFSDESEVGSRLRLILVGNGFMVDAEDVDRDMATQPLIRQDYWHSESQTCQLMTSPQWNSPTVPATRIS